MKSRIFRELVRLGYGTDWSTIKWAYRNYGVIMQQENKEY